jgi:hypothetical protein
MQALTRRLVPSRPKAARYFNSVDQGATWPYWQLDVRLLRYLPCVTTGGFDDP